VNAVVLDIILK